MPLFVWLYRLWVAVLGLSPASVEVDVGKQSVHSALTDFTWFIPIVRFIITCPFKRKYFVFQGSQKPGF